MPIASLRMYDLPELRGILDDWWGGLGRHLRAAGVEGVPDRLSRDDDHRQPWRAPDLCLAQACGYPLTHAFRGLIKVVATPCYDAPGCAGASYRSLVVVSDANPAHSLAGLRGGIAAYNSRDSHSGYNALRAMLAPHAERGRFLARSLETGSHAASLIAVQERAADLAAIDCVTFALASRHRPSAVTGLRILAESQPAPGLPYVTAAARGTEALARLRAGLFAALADADLAECRDALLIKGAELLPGDAYEAINGFERAAVDLGYQALS